MTEWTKPYCGYSYYGKFEDQRYGSLSNFGSFVEVVLYERRKSRYSDNVFHHAIDSKMFLGEDCVGRAKRYIEQFVKGE